jgi:valyl-tRNA synthetase
MSSLGWPNTDSADLKRFYPLNVMETGSDILFFWVARMVMMCTHLYGTPPFNEVITWAFFRYEDLSASFNFAHISLFCVVGKFLSPPQ